MSDKLTVVKCIGIFDTYRDKFGEDPDGFEISKKAWNSLCEDCESLAIHETNEVFKKMIPNGAKAVIDGVPIYVTGE